MAPGGVRICDIEKLFMHGQSETGFDKTGEETHGWLFGLTRYNCFENHLIIAVNLT